MWCNMLKCCNFSCIFFDKILYCLHSHTSALDRVEECVFMTFSWYNFRTRIIYIIFKCICNIIAKIYIFFLAAFSYNSYTTFFKINIFYIQSYTLGNTDACPKKKSKDCNISQLVFLIKYFFTTCEIITCVFYKV